MPKSEVLRRAIRIAAVEKSLDGSSKLAALDRLQASLRERKIDISQWALDARAERRSAVRWRPSKTS